MSAFKAASIKELHNSLKKELEIITRKSFQVHQELDNKKQKALLEYKKLQLIKAGKSLTPDALMALQKLTQMKAPVVDTTFVDHIVNKNEHSIEDKLHMTNIVTFLSNQRQYQELLERYNPGLRMDQKENVRKSAHRVGLDIPE